MNANTQAVTYGNCSFCHHNARVEYQNDSFGTRIIRIG